MASAPFFIRLTSTCSIRDGVGHHRAAGARRHSASGARCGGAVRCRPIPRLRWTIECTSASARLGSLLFHERADALDDLARALAWWAVLQGREQGLFGELAALDARDHAAAVVVDGGERLVQFVRHADAISPMVIRRLTDCARSAWRWLALQWRRGVMSVAITIWARRPSTQFR